jgi:hypothetical protein
MTINPEPNETMDATKTSSAANGPNGHQINADPEPDGPEVDDGPPLESALLFGCTPLAVGEDSKARIALLSEIRSHRAKGFLRETNGGGPHPCSMGGTALSSPAGGPCLRKPLQGIDVSAVADLPTPQLTRIENRGGLFRRGRESAR